MLKYAISDRKLYKAELIVILESIGCKKSKYVENPNRQFPPNFCNMIC